MHEWPFVKPVARVTDMTFLRDSITERVLGGCTTSFGEQLKAIVLTGSMARDETSYVCTEGMWNISGDAEFMLVLKERAALPSAATLSMLRQDLERHLSQNHIRCTIDLSAVRHSYFRNLPPHIFTYELKHDGRVVWGDDRILQTIPAFSVDDLSREDAWRLLCNRLLEVLDCAPELADEGDSPSATLQYKTLKLYLDMATSLLVFLRAYAPTYRERRESLRWLAEGSDRTEDYPFDLQGLAESVSACTDMKLQCQGHPIGSNDLTWRAAVRTAHSLWRWELSRLAGVREPLPDRELFEKWMRLQSPRESVRGWAYVLRARGWHKSVRDWPHWLRLCWKGSPRYWIYFVASTLLFQLADDGSPSDQRASIIDWSALGDLLPVRNTAANGHGQGSWTSLATDVVGNYKEFLARTRA